jgi:hypothetical protein
MASILAVYHHHQLRRCQLPDDTYPEVLAPERLAAMRIGHNFLSPAEKQLFVGILFDYEGAVALDESEMGLLHHSIEPPVVIHTVPHTPWQQQNPRLPKAMQDVATAHVKRQTGTRNPRIVTRSLSSRHFLVAKKNGEHRFINDVQLLNKVTIRDSRMPPSVDQFSEDFAGYPITSAIDYFSGYYQIPLDKSGRDLTAFMTLLGLVRMTRLPQGWTNSVAEFMRIIGKVHYRQIPHEVRPFLDDVGIKGPKNRCSDEEISPGIRRFVFEHSQIFRRFMCDCWNAGLTISDFLIRNGYLFKRSRKRGLPPRRVVGLKEQRLAIIRELHDEIGHRESNRLSNRYGGAINGRDCTTMLSNMSKHAKNASGVLDH